MKMKYINNSNKTKFLKEKGKFLSVDPGDIIDLENRNIIEPGLDKAPKEKQVPKPDKSDKDKKVESRIKDLKADLADDGKRNYSHDEKRKSPGRKKVK